MSYLGFDQLHLRISRGMGIAQSCFSIGGRLRLEEIEADVDSGDIVWLSRAAQSTAPYIMRTPSWESFTDVGFLVRSGNGLELCWQGKHDGAAGPARESLAAILSLGGYSKVAITRLKVPLDQDAREQLRSFMDGHVKNLNDKVVLHMSWERRMVCSRQVALMLVAVGRALEVDQKSYQALDGNLLRSPIFLEVGRSANDLASVEPCPTEFYTPAGSVASENASSVCLEDAASMKEESLPLVSETSPTAQPACRPPGRSRLSAVSNGEHCTEDHRWPEGGSGETRARSTAWTLWASTPVVPVIETNS